MSQHLRIVFPCAESGNGSGDLTNQLQMRNGEACYDTIGVRTVLPPDGAFNGKSLREGGYGDPVGQGNNVILSLMCCEN